MWRDCGFYSDNPARKVNWYEKEKSDNKILAFENAIKALEEKKKEACKTEDEMPKEIVHGIDVFKSMPDEIKGE